MTYVFHMTNNIFIDYKRQNRHNNLIYLLDTRHFLLIGSILFCDALVFSAWFCIATRMIMSESHRYSIGK